MEEKETMEYQFMKRKQLQALCKKHGVPANLSNREMADRLSSILKVSQKLTSRGESLLKNSSKKVNAKDSKAKTKVVKKVRFSPENQTFFYEVSGRKRDGKRRCTLKTVPKKHKATESDVFSTSPIGRKRARIDVKKQSLEMRSSAEGCVVELGEGNVIGGSIWRQLRNRKVEVEKTDGDLVISRKKVTRGGSKMVRNEVTEENVTDSKDAKLEKISKISGRITRSHAQFESRDSENEKDEGDCEKATQLKEPSEGVSIKALTRKSAEAAKVLRKRKQGVMNDEGCKMVSGNSRKVESVCRITRSRAKTSAEASAAESKNEEETVRPGELSKGVGRNALVQQSAEENKVLRKGKRYVPEDKCREMWNENSRKVEHANRITRSRSKTVRETSAAESKNEEEIVQPEGFSKGPDKYTLRQKSVVSNKVKMEKNEVRMKKESRKRLRKVDLDGASDLEAILDTSKESEMIKDISAPTGHSRRTRRNTAMFISTYSTGGQLESRKNVGQKKSYVTKIIPRRSRRNVTDTVTDSAEADTVIQKEETNETNVINDQAFKSSSKNPRKFRSVDSIIKSKTKVVGRASTAQSETEEKNVQLEEPVVSNVISLEITSSVGGFSPADQLYDSDEPLNMVNLQNIHETEDQSIGKNENHRCDNMDDHSNKDDRTSAQEYQNLEKFENVKENSAKPLVQEAVFKEPLNYLSTNSSEKKLEIPVDITEEINMIDPSNLEGVSPTESFLDATKTQELTTESQLVATEISTEKTTEIQLSTASGNVTEPTMCKPTLEAFDNRANNSYVQSLSASNDVMREEENKAAVQSIGLERQNANVVGRDKLSGEKIMNEGYERNLFVGGGAIPISVKNDGKGANNKETEVLGTENKFSEQNSKNVSNETSGRYMRELSDANGINMIIMEETVRGTVDKESFPYEPDFLKNHVEHENDVFPVAFTSDPSKILSACKDKLLVHSDVQDTLKSKVHEDVEDGSEVEVQEETLLQFASGESRDGLEGDTPNANNISGKVLCQLIGNCNSINETEEQVRADIFSKEFQLDESNAARSSELVLEKVYDSANLVVEANSSIDMTAEDVAIGEHYAAIKRIDDKAFNGESYVEQFADVAKGEIVNCPRSVHEVVAPQENGTTGTLLTELISKESEVSIEKDVETMIKSAECTVRVDNLTVKESKSETRNSHTVGNDVSSVGQVTGNHLVEKETLEVRDVSVQNIRIVADEETHTMSVEKRESLKESEKVETSLPVSWEIPKKTCTDELAENIDSTPDVLNEVIHVNGEDLEESSNEVCFLPPADEGKFDDLDNYSKQNVQELERRTSVISDNFMSMSGRAAYRKENVGITAGHLNSNDNSSDAQKEDNIDAILQITKKAINDHLPDAKLCNANDSVHSVLLCYGSSTIGIEADDSDGKVGSEKIEAGSKWLEETPTFSQANSSKRKHGERNYSESRFFADTSFDKPEIGSANEAVDKDFPFKMDDQVAKKTTSNKLLCSNRRSITEVAEEGTCSNELCDAVATENIEESHVVSSLMPRMSADLSTFSPSTDYSKHESRSLEFHIGSPQLISWELNMILESGDQVDVKKSAAGILEANLTTQDCEDVVQVKENLRTNELIDQQTTEKHLDEQEHHNYLTVSDEPICNKEPNQQNEPSAISQECMYYEIQKEKSNVGPEKVMLIEDAAPKGSNIADLDEFKADYVVDDIKEAENIAVDTGVFGCSRSRGNSMDKEVYTEASRKMNTREFENVGTILPVTPQELSADCGNTKETSHEISGAILPQIFQCGGGCKDKFFIKMPEHDVHSQDCNIDAGRKEMADEEIGNSCGDKAFHCQEDNEATIEDTEAVDRFSLEHNGSDCQEVVKNQIKESEAAANEATFIDSIYCLNLNQPSCGDKGKRHVIEIEEADKFHRPDDKVATTSDFNKAVDFENLMVASSLIPEMAVDCSAVSPLSATSNHDKKSLELNVESYIFTRPEIKLFSGSGGQDETENSDAGASGANLISKDAKDVKENVMIVVKVDAQLTEEQLSEQKTTVEVPKLSTALHSDLDEPTCSGSKCSTKHKNMRSIIHGTPDNKNLKNELLKFENTNLATRREAAGEDAWKLELKLLSPQRSPEAKTGGNTWFAKKLNSPLKKQNKSALIQRTPKRLGHDRKENLLSTKKRKIGNFTAPKSLSRRRALEDIRR